LEFWTELSSCVRLKYLFILRDEVFTRLTKPAHLNGKLTGFPIGGGYGHLGYLLYMDDYLLVARATNAEAKIVNELL